MFRVWSVSSSIGLGLNVRSMANSEDLVNESLYSVSENISRHGAREDACQLALHILEAEGGPGRGRR